MIRFIKNKINNIREGIDDFFKDICIERNAENSGR